MTEQTTTMMAVTQQPRRLSKEGILQEVHQILSPTISKIRGIHSKMAGTVIRSAHAIGRTLISDDELLKEADGKREAYQVKTPTLQVIAEAVDTDASTLSKCRKFAALYDESDLDDLLANGLNWTHIRNLVTVSDDAARQRLINRVNDEHLTADELSRIIIGECGNRKPGAGRKAKPSKSLRRNLDRTLNAARKFQTGTLELFFDNAADQYDLPTQVLSTPPEALQQGYLNDLAAIIQHLSSQEQRIPDVKAALEHAHDHVRGVLAARERREREQPDGDEDRDPFDPAVLARSARTTEEDQ